MIEVHHLNNSRSQRILWLLEELGLDYKIVKHTRDAATNLAPPSLLAVHPLGKSPLIRDDGQVVIESARAMSSETLPASSVTTSGSHSNVSGNSLRTRIASGPEPPSIPPSPPNAIISIGIGMASMPGRSE